MKKLLFPFFICLSLILSTSFAQNKSQKLPPLRYAPNREFHMENLSLDFHFNVNKKELFGVATEKIVPLREDYRDITLNATGMTINKVVMNHKSLNYSYDGKELIIKLDKSYGLNDTLTYSVTYSTIPKKGIFFVSPDSAYPNRTPEIWSQSEEEDAQYWYPCHDYPDDFSTSDITATVPEDWVVVSNGILSKVRTDRKNKTKTFYWVENIPHVVYLNSIVAGKYQIIKDKFDDIPTYYYVEPRYAKDAKLDFKDEPDILKYYSKVTGYKYPWQKLALTTVTDFTEGGMENVSAITLTDNTLHGKNAEPNESSVELIAHETAHQWFGDLLTCRTWGNAWLNEGFADFFEAMYQRHLRGQDYFSYEMNNYHNTVIRADNQHRQSTYYARYNVPDDVFSNYIYPRGASILNMLRGILGDKLFFKAIKYYVHKFQHENVDTHDFKNAIEEATGENLYWFFNEWVYKAGHPKFDINYSYNPTSQKLTLNVAQTQKVDSLTPVFRMPVHIFIETSSEKIHKTVLVDSLKNSFQFIVYEKPLMVNFDEGDWILKEVNFKKSEEELAYQLKNDPDVAGRIWAADKLGKMKDDKSAENALINSISNDNFWAVRSEAAKQLASFEDQVSEKALLSALNDKDTRVQTEAIKSLAGFKNENVAKILKDKFSKDNNYFIKAACISSLASVDSIKALPEINEALTMNSYRSIIKNAAMGALIKVDSTKGYKQAVIFSKYGQPENLRVPAVITLARHDVNKNETLNLLRTYMKDPYIWVRLVTYYSLGQIGNKSFLPLLHKREKAETNSRLIEAAQQAIEKIEQQINNT